MSFEIIKLGHCTVKIIKVWIDCKGILHYPKKYHHQYIKQDDFTCYCKLYDESTNLIYMEKLS